MFRMRACPFVPVLGLLLLACGCGQNRIASSSAEPGTGDAAVLGTEAIETAHGDAALPGAEGLDAVAWLQGTWRMHEGDFVIEELWTAPGGGTMLGLNRTMRGGETLAFEFLRLEIEGEAIDYVAHPNLRNPGTRFRLRDPDRARAGEAVFENPEHDFPKQIAYRRADADTLAVSVTGDGPPLAFEFHRAAAP